MVDLAIPCGRKMQYHIKNNFYKFIKKEHNIFKSQNWLTLQQQRKLELVVVLWT
jgi:hypothetical protein